jgi:hypothetical protein
MILKHMNILILNGTPDLFYTDFERHLEKYKTMLHHLGYYVRVFQLNQIMNEHDAFGYLARAIPEADAVLFTSPLVNGKVSDLIQKMHKTLSDNTGDHGTSVNRKNPLVAMITLGEDCENVDIPEDMLLHISSHQRHVVIRSRTHTEAVFETIRNIRAQKAISELVS